MDIFIISSYELSKLDETDLLDYMDKFEAHYSWRNEEEGEEVGLTLIQGSIYWFSLETFFFSFCKIVMYPALLLFKSELDSYTNDVL